MKVQKTWTGPSLGGRAWSRGLKSVLSKILQVRNTITNFQKLNFKNEALKTLDSKKIVTIISIFYGESWNFLSF